MGIYVQQEKYKIIMPMFGIWGDVTPNVEIDVCKNNNMVMLTFPETILTQIPSLFPMYIHGILPGNLWPTKDLVFNWLGLNSGGATNLFVSVFASNGSIFIGTGNNNSPFSTEISPGGFYAQNISYQIKELPA
jgi:hypothetical protein